MMNVHRLLGVKPIENLTEYEWIIFLFYLTFWTSFAPLVLFLQIFLKILFAYSQRYRNDIAISIFKI
jgi:hypothetical protein